MTFNCYMHPRNIYRTRPDFKQLASEYPEFSEYAITDERDRVHINFKDANSLRCLTRTLLKKDFGLEISIPVNYLIPTVPQRLNYVLWIEDLLCALPCDDNDTVNGIDIGTGPCCIFSVLGAQKNGWKFLATESEEESFQWASKNVFDNDLQEQVKLCKVDKDVVLKGVMTEKDEVFDFCMCNPPFFHDPDELYQRKKIQIESEIESMEIKHNEVIVQGGEVEFIKKMIRDSVDIREKVRIYTSMFGKKKSLVAIKNELKKVDNVNYVFTEFCQGNTMRWGVAWTFIKGVVLSQVHCSKRKKKKKPINFLIPKSVKGYSIKKLLQQIIAILKELSIQYEIKTETRLNVLLLIKSNENTWSHQRRKRRQAQHLANINVQSKPDDDKIILVTSTASLATNNITELSCSHIAGDKEGGCNASTIDSCMECSETPSEMESVEHMDTEVLSDDEAVCSQGADDSEDAPLGNKLAESGGEVKSYATSESTCVGFRSVVEENSLAISCEAPTCDACSGRSSKSLSVGIKRILDQEDIVEDCSTKRPKNVCGEMPDISSDIPDISSDIPLLFCSLELKRHCDKIMLEMSCEEQFNRQSMSEILQLFKNRLK